MIVKEVRLTGHRKLVMSATPLTAAAGQVTQLHEVYVQKPSGFRIPLLKNAHPATAHAFVEGYLAAIKQELRQ